MRPRLVIGNWKMNPPTVDGARDRSSFDLDCAGGFFRVHEAEKNMPCGGRQKR